MPRIADPLTEITGGASAAVADDLVKFGCQGQSQPVSGQLTVTGSMDGSNAARLEEPKLWTIPNFVFSRDKTKPSLNWPGPVFVWCHEASNHLCQA